MVRQSVERQLNELEEVIVAFATVVERAGSAGAAKHQGLFDRCDCWYERALELVGQDAGDDAELVWQRLLEKAAFQRQAARALGEALAGIERREPTIASLVS